MQSDQDNVAQDDADLDLYSGVGDVPGLSAEHLVATDVKNLVSKTPAQSASRVLSTASSALSFAFRFCFSLVNLWLLACLRLPVLTSNFYMHSKYCLVVHSAPDHVKTVTSGHCFFNASLKTAASFTS